MIRHESVNPGPVVRRSPTPGHAFRGDEPSRDEDLPLLGKIVESGFRSWCGGVQALQVGTLGEGDRVIECMAGLFE